MQQNCKLNIQARTQIFNFKLKATKILPNGELHRFSLLVRLHKFILKLQLKSGSTISISTHQKRTFKSTFLSLLEKLRLPRTKKALTIQHPDFKSIRNQLKQFTNKKSNYVGSLVIAIVALLLLMLQSIFKKDGKGIVIRISIILLCYWISYFSRHLRGKTRIFWIVLIVGTAGSSCVAFNLGKDYVSENAWNWIEWSYESTVFSWVFSMQLAFQMILALVKIFLLSYLKA